jgi:hypothetical protein
MTEEGFSYKATAKLFSIIYTCIQINGQKYTCYSDRHMKIEVFTVPFGTEVFVKK